MNTLKKIFLGDKANSYILDSLNSGKTLSKLLAEVHDIKKGNIFTYIPDNLDLEDAEDFSGGLYKTKNRLLVHEYYLPNGKLGVVKNKQYIPDASYWLVDEIMNKLTLKEGSAGILEDPIQQVHDPVQQSELADNEFYFGSEVYHIINKKMDADDAQTIISRIYNFSPPLVGAIVDISEEIPQRKLIEKDLLRKLAESAKYIIVGAYDSEGYLIWEKQ